MKQSTKKRFKQIMCMLLCTIFIVCSIPDTAFAQDSQTEDSSVFSVLEIRKGSLNGETVVDLLNPASNWSLNTETDYYIYGSFKRKTGNDYLRIRFGNSDGTYNGTTFFNPPGGTYTAGSITHDYLDQLTAFKAYDNPTYGSSNYAISLQDGEMIYHIKDDVAANSDINFAMGMIINDAVYSGTTTIQDAIQVAVGNYTNSTFTPTYVKTSNLVMASKGAMRVYYNTTGLTATLDGTGAMAQVYVSDVDKNHETALLYNSLEFDINYPSNATLDGVSFSSGNLTTKTSTTYGTLTVSEPTTSGDISTVHITVSNGYRTKGSSLSIFYRLSFQSPTYTDGETAKTNVSNTFFQAKDGTTCDVTDTTTKITYTIMDSNKDNTTMSAVNRSAVYNHTLDGSADYMLSMGGVSIVNKSVSTSTPREKTYEASFNTTNTAANISMITVPVGTSTTPVISLTGKDADGNVISKTVENPAAYGSTVNNIAKSSYFLFKASDFGMVTFTGVKAEIGKIRANYKSCSWTSNWIYTGNYSAAFGYFTTPESGILVKNTYRLYNTDPAYRDQLAGDLTVSSTATSTLNGRVGYSGSVTAIKNSENKTTDSIAAGDSVKLSGNVVPYSIVGAEKQGTLYGTTSMIMDPVIYLTLPRGLSYESLAFRIGTSSSVATTATYKIENVSYLNTTGDGVSLYKVTFPTGTKLGYYNGDKVCNYIYYDITLKTSKSLETRRYEINELIGISSTHNLQAMPYSSNPSTLNTIVTDTYGLNGGKDYAGITRGSATNQPGFGLQQMAEINVYNAVSVTKVNGKEVPENWHAYDASDPNSIVNLGANSSGQFRVDIENTSDIAATGLAIAIPIPKKGQDLGDLFMDQAAEFSMDFTYSAADFTTQGFDISYVTLTKQDSDDTFVTSTTSEASANAILLTCDTVPAHGKYTFYFDFTVNNGTANAMNIWKDAFYYTTSDNTIEHKTGSYVASAVAPGSISGIVFQDDNRNGKQDEEEVGIAGITVVAKDADNKILSTTTDENGAYQFVAVRETDVSLTFTVAASKALRFNINNELLAVPSADGLSAMKSLEQVEAATTVNAALSSYYVVDYNKNSGSGDVPTSGEYVSGQTATVEVKPDNLLRTGYVFKEWNTVANGSGTGYQPGETFTVNENTTLYAIWEVGTYNISFNYRGATDGNDTTQKTLTHNQTYNTGETLPTPVKTGYNFAGWSNSSTGTTVNVTNATKFVLGTDTTLYAVWNAKTGYTVSFDAGEGSTVESKTVDWDDLVLSAETSTRIGYEFIGWNYGETAVTSTMTYGDLAGSDDSLESIVLTAQWKAKTGFTVNYKDGDTSLFTAKSVSWNSTGLLPESNPTKSGFAFAGWKDSEGNAVNAQVSYGDLAKTEDITAITLLASWTELSDNTVHYNTNGGTMYNDKTGVKNSDAQLIPETEPVRAGYTFAGWSYEGKSVVSTTVYSDLTNNTEITLTADWVAKEYQITYNYGGYEVLTKYYSDAGILPAVAPTKAGSTFAGWYFGTALVTDTTTVASLLPQDSANQIALTAAWTEHTYTIVYESNGGTYYSPKTNVAYSATGLLPDAIPTRTGYTFSGWYSGNTLVSSSTACSELIEGDSTTITLSARWASKTGYVVNYNSAGGTVLSNRTKVGWSDTNLLPSTTPTRTGYTFGGWVCGRTIVTNATAYSALASTDAAGSSITLVVQWNSGSYTVHYDTDGGTTVEDKSVAWASTGLLPYKDIKKDGFIFLGWTYLGTEVTSVNAYSDLAENDTVSEITLTANYKAMDGSYDVEDFNGLGTDVQGKVIEVTPNPIYKIDLSWGPMKFTFNTKSVWNPDTHAYEKGEQGNWSYESLDGSNNRITAYNHSNADLQVNFTVEREVLGQSSTGSSEVDVEGTDALNGILLSVLQANSSNSTAAMGMPLPKVPQEGAAAPSISSYLWLQGEPENISFLSTEAYTKIGTITVTIQPNGGTLTPYNE